jgi:hypothetical protein
MSATTTCVSSLPKTRDNANKDRIRTSSSAARMYATQRVRPELSPMVEMLNAPPELALLHHFQKLAVCRLALLALQLNIQMKWI